MLWFVQSAESVKNKILTQIGNERRANMKVMLKFKNPFMKQNFQDSTPG